MTSRALPLAALSLLVACNESNNHAPPPATTTATTPVVSAMPSATASAGPSAEDKKKAEEAKQLADDRSKMQSSIKAEEMRWTPELHEEAKALVAKKYASVGAAIDAALASKTRMPGNKKRDASRHPKEELTFFGLKPTMTVLEVGPGEGWYTEILAPVLAPQGKLMVTTTDPNASVDLRPTMYAQRTRAFLAKSPELYGKVQPVVFDPQAPALNLDGSVDMVLVIRGLHGMVQQGNLTRWLGEYHKALKPDGVLGIEQHRSKPDATSDQDGKRGYLPEAWVIQQIEAAGFKLAGKSEINANPKDTKDYEPGVWALPPTYRLGDKDRDRYTAIGESDRMTLRFVKVPLKDAKGAASGAPAASAAPKK